MNTRAAAEPLSLTQAAQVLLDECRMVLPGIQALFGFQLIAVFSPRFAEALGPASSGCTSWPSSWWDPIHFEAPSQK